MSGTDFSHHSEPLGGNSIISNGKISLIFTDLVVADQTVENGPVGRDTVVKSGGMRLIVSVIACRGRVMITVVAGAVREVGKSGNAGGIRAVRRIHLIAGDLKLLTVSFEVRTVGKSGIEVNFNRGESLLIVFEVAGEIQISRQNAVRIPHQNRQSVDGDIILIVGGNFADIGVIHQNLKVENRAQGNRTHIKLVLGIFEGGFLEFAVLFGNAAVFNGEQNFVVGISHGAHQQTAGIRFKVFAVVDTDLGRKHIEFTGKTVKEQPVGGNAGAGGQTVGAFVVSVALVGVVDLMSRPVMGVAERKVCADRGGVSTQSLMIFCLGGIDREGGGKIIGVVQKGDSLRIGKRKLFHTLEKFIVLIFFTLCKSITVSGFGSRRIVVAAAQQNQSGKERETHIYFHFSCSLLKNYNRK